MKNFRFGWAFALLLSLLVQPLQAAPNAAATKWNITTLPSLGPRGAIALVINNAGDVGGYSAVVPPGSTSWYHHAVLWRNGKAIDLGSQLGSPPGYTFSQVSALNDRGTAVVTGYEGVTIWRNG